MTTANIILAIMLTVLSIIAALFIIRYMRKFVEVENKAADLAEQEKGIRRRHATLDRWSEELKAQAVRQNRYKHVYANVIIDDPDGTAPDFPDTATYKKMKSNLGYKVVPAFRDYIKATHKDGKTKYSLDLYVSPYDEA